MSKYKYQFKTIYCRLGKDLNTDVTDSIDAVLDGMGAQGWTLKAAMTNQDHSGHYQYIYTFERQVS